MTQTPIIQPTNKDKVIFVDWNIYVFKSIFGWAREKTIPATWKCLNSLIADLKYFNLTPDDTIILAVDSRKGSWRKDIDSNYKANRKANREKHKDIDWNAQFEDFNNLLENLDISTPFHIINIDRLEADDIIAQGVKFFSDRECVIVSTDSDYEQLTANKNVKLFSPISKKFKVITNPYKLLAQKIKKETTDNLVTEVATEYEYNKRKMLVSLLSLPAEIIEKVNNALLRLTNKDFDLEQMRFAKLRAKFMDIYNTKKELKNCVKCVSFLGDDVKCKKERMTKGFGLCNEFRKRRDKKQQLLDEIKPLDV